jgi:hypothetical protein
MNRTKKEEKNRLPKPCSAICYTKKRLKIENGAMNSAMGGPSVVPLADAGVAHQKGLAASGSRTPPVESHLRRQRVPCWAHPPWLTYEECRVFSDRRANQ